MSGSLLELKNSIMTIVKDNNYTIDDFKVFLGPLSEYLNSPTLVDHLRELVQEILKDRDGSGHFSIDDLNMLKDDILGITTLINAVLLVLGSLPEFKLKYEAGATEEIVFKVFAFIFLVVVPKESGKPWNEDEKEKVVGANANNEEVVEEHLPQARAELGDAMLKVKDAARTHREMADLRRELDNLKK